MKTNTQTWEALGLFIAGAALIVIATKKFGTLEEILTIFAIIIGIKLMLLALRKLKISK